MQIPTSQEIFSGVGFRCVDQQVCEGWERGVRRRREIYLRKSDQTYWSAEYGNSHDGSRNDLRDGSANIFQVEPYDVTVKQYRSVSTT